MDKTNRLQIEMDDERIQDMEQLMKDCGMRTKKEFVNNAFTLLEWAVRERKKGFIIASFDEDNDRLRELALPILDRLKTTEEVEPSVHA